MGIKETIKRVLLKTLPEPVLRPLKKAYLARAYRNVKPEDLRDAPVVPLLIGPGACALDIGSSVGYYAKVFSDLVGPTGKVHVFEPLPQSFEILQSNMERWKRDNAELHPVAVSDRSETVTMSIPKKSSGGEDYYEARITGQDKDDDHLYVQVKTVTLDSLFHDAAHPLHFIKVDAMGNELPCIEGARAVIERDAPAFLIAFYSNPNHEGSDGARVFEILTGEFGYGIYWFDGKQLHPWKPGESSYRYFFLKPGHVRTLEAKGILAAAGPAA